MFFRGITIYRTLFILVSVVLLFTGYFYHHHIINLYEYSFFQAPYINRVFYTKRILIDPTSSNSNLYHNLINDPSYGDNRSGTANFNRPFKDQLTINYSMSGIKNYESFINEYFDAFKMYKGITSDKVAKSLMRFIHLNWKRNYKFPKFSQDEVIREIETKPEKDRNPEDLIYRFVNYKCGCGTISETATTLLRELGFKTRLLRISKEKNKEIANHVFVEYYSVESEKWVMFDAMENIIPRRNGKLLSAFEFFQNPEDEEKYKKTNKLYRHATGSAEIWFQINGPISTVFVLIL